MEMVCIELIDRIQSNISDESQKQIHVKWTVKRLNLMFAGVRLAIGASGGPKIITAVAYTALRHLWLGDNIKEAIDAARLHHQLFPVNVENEPCFPDNILNELGKRKHEIKELAKGVRGAIVMGITRSRSGVIEANSDYRKGGTVAGDH